MADRDPAFLWETEALRTSAMPPSPAPAARAVTTDWRTLREASDATGIPVPTLRNWARKGRIPSSLEETPSGTHRMVSLQGVAARARQLGHEVAPVADSRDSETVARPTRDPDRQDQVTAPPGTMLVPIDAWDKMLLQLGNLHQAGQQLAEARERAARAETEASFLRERLAELREAREAPVAEPEPETQPVDRVPSEDVESEQVKPSKMPSFTAYLWRMAVSDRRRK